MTTIFSRYAGEGVALAWDEALSRRQSDPEGAITAARTLLEEVCKHIGPKGQVPSAGNGGARGHPQQSGQLSVGPAT